MQKGTYDTYKVPGLGLSVSNEDNFAWVIFTDDRSLTKDFYSWFITDCLIPIVQNIRKCYKLEMAANMCFLQIDGENVQLEAFLDKDIRAMLRENNIKVGKSSASSTEIEQECDAGNTFKAPKTKIKHLKFTRVDRTSDLYIRLKQLWKEHQRNCGTTITDNHTKSAVDGLILVHAVVKSCYTQTLIENCFKKTGSHPFNIDQIITNCYSTFTGREQRLLKGNMDYLSRIIDKKGEFFDSDIALVGIAKNIDKTAPKESLVLMKRRALLLTHDRVLERICETKEAKLMTRQDKESTLIEKSIRQAIRERIAAEEKLAKALRATNKRHQKDLENQAKQKERERKKAYNEAVKAEKASKRTKTQVSNNSLP